MNTAKVPYSSFEVYMEEGKHTSFRDVVSKYLYHWPLFLLFISLSLTAAFFYLRYAPPGYTAKAKLLIKDDEKGNGAEAALKELNLFKSGTLVENELELLKSRSLMAKVVNDLHLETQYMVQGAIRFEDVYKESPVRLTLLKPGAGVDPQTIKIILKDNKHFILKQENSEAPVSFSSRLVNSLGTWEIAPTPYLYKFKGKLMKIVTNSPDVVTDGYVSRLNANLSSKEATVVELSIREPVPQRGKDVLDKLIAVYNNAEVNDKNKVRQSTLNFIDTRLASLTGELTSAEKTVENFKSSRGLMDISSESKFFLENVKDNDTRLNEVNVQLEVVNGIEKYVNSPQGSGRAPATAGITDPGLVALVNQLMTLELKRDQLLDASPEGSPIFETINRQINSTKHSIRETIRGIKASLLASKRQLQNFNSNFENSIKKLPGQEREFISIKRQQSIKEELYVYLLQKREEAAVSYASTIADSRTVDQAHVGLPDSPNKKICYGIAFLTGLLIPFGMIFGRDIMNNRILTAKEIQDSTSVPVLAELVYQKSSSAVVMQDKSRKMIAEQFRSLRTNLHYIYDKHGSGRVTLLTSGMSGEGKSFVTCNLGAALAAAGRKTIIMEMDLRSPKICKYLHITPSSGISQYLNGECNKEEIIQSSGLHNNLFVAPAGAIPDYPTELIGKPEMKELMDWLSTEFDEILIDTPPIKLVSDALMLSKYSDVNLFIVRHGVTYKSQLDFIKQLFVEGKLKNLNIVFNGIAMSGPGDSYHYGYYLDKGQSRKEALETGVRDFFKRF